MLHETRTEVLVVGAGPVGMVAALTLAERGVPLKIVDRAPNVASQSYACALHPGSLQLLAELGISNDVVRMGRRLDTLAFYDGAERRAEIQFSQLGTDFPFLLVIPQSSVETVLQQRLAALHGTNVDWNQQLSDLHADGEAVLSCVDQLGETAKGYAVADWDSTVERTLHIGSQFLIAADGATSTVRDQLGIAMEHPAEPKTFVVCEFQTSAPVSNEVRVVLDDQTVNVLWPISVGRCRWGVEIGAVDSDDFPSKERSRISAEEPGSETEYRRMLVDFVTRHAPWFQANIGKIEWIAEVPFHAGVAERFGKGRCWLAGDAAHQAEPVGAQSMNVGLREAVELGRIIGKILRDNAPRDLLAEYERHQRIEWQQLLSGQLGEISQGATNKWVAARMSRLLPCVPGSGPHLVRALAQLGVQLI